jgi:riboflavin kinase/FMN adenylyltransferase
MIVARAIGELKREKNSVVTVGTFDGVHLAHQEIVREVVHRAKMKEGRSVVVTFDPHPKEVVGEFKEPIHLLTTVDERRELLDALNVDVLFVIEFTKEFSQQNSREFFERYLVNGTGVSEVVVGYDHKFGTKRQGSAEALVRMGEVFDFSVFSFHPYTVNGEVVSSTLVRHALTNGEVERAHAFLGREYSLRGTVVAGDGRGRTIGYPTANIEPESRSKLIPATGVYLVGVQIAEKKFFGMMNIGVRPTVTDGTQQVMEAHLFDFTGDAYGKRVTISFLKRLRDEQKFASLQELIAQLGKDENVSRKHISEILQRHKDKNSISNP